MQAAARKFADSPLEYRRFRPEESDVLPRFFLQAGYMLPVAPQDTGWGAWADGDLVGALALSNMQGSWLLRGPEIVSQFRRRGVGAALLDLALPDIRGFDCFCPAYSNLVRMFARVGFRVCLPAEAPPYLAQQLAIVRQTQLNLILLRRPPG
jgi:hypothetical protein